MATGAETKADAGHKRGAADPIHLHLGDACAAHSSVRCTNQCPGAPSREVTPDHESQAKPMSPRSPLANARRKKKPPAPRDRGFVGDRRRRDDRDCEGPWSKIVGRCCANCDW